ncbi:MAG: hypothetical protein D6736_05035 [Nitrospinota bacterium]|nr:MAG: hypothetical protein D6736_05035 [Nitrospinota bacterium]
MHIQTDRTTKWLLFLIFLALLANLIRSFSPPPQVYADGVFLNQGYVATEAPRLHLWRVEGNRVRLVARAEAFTTNVTRGETTFRWTRGVEERP